MALEPENCVSFVQDPVYCSVYCSIYSSSHQRTAGVFGPLRLSSWVQMRLLMGQMRLLMSTYLIGVSCHLCVRLPLAQGNDEVLVSPGTWSLLVKRTALGSHPKLRCLPASVNFASFSKVFFILSGSTAAFTLSFSSESFSLLSRIHAPPHPHQPQIIPFFSLILADYSV